MIVAGDFNVIPTPDDVYAPAAWVERRPVPAGDARPFPGAGQSRPDRRLPRLPRRAEPLHLLGLSGRRLAEEPRLAHRPYAAVAAGRGPARQMRDRSRPRAAGRSRPTTCRCGSSSTLSALSPNGSEAAPVAACAKPRARLVPQALEAASPIAIGAGRCSRLA